MKTIITIIAIALTYVALAGSGIKCSNCKGSGWDGKFKCVSCGGDGEY
jgi:hypothetical protein